MILASSSSVLLSSQGLIFIVKILACGMLGFLILGGLRLIIDSLMNPKGWNLGEDLYDHEEDPFMKEDNMTSLNYQVVRSDEDERLSRRLRRK